MITDKSKLNKEAILYWVENLENGNYEQGQNGLKVDNKFCCLGVASDLTNLGKWVYDNEEFYGYEIFEQPDCEYSVSRFTKSVANYYGFKTCDTIPEVELDQEAFYLLSNLHPKLNFKLEAEVALSLLNDSGLSFTHIARLIRNTYLT